MASLTIACVASAVAVYGFVRHYRSKPEEEEAAKTIQAGVRGWATFADRLRAKSAAQAIKERYLAAADVSQSETGEETTN